MSGVSVGVAAKGRNGEFVINNLIEIKVPIAAKTAVKKAVNATKSAAKATVKVVEKGADKVKHAAKDEASKASKELKCFGELDLDKCLNEDERSSVMNALRDMARKQSGKTVESDVPDVKGNTSIGGSASNSNINAALKWAGFGAYLPTDGSTGAYVYINEETKKLSGFAVQLKWVVGGTK